MRIAPIILSLLLAATSRGEWYQYSPAGCCDGQGILRDVLSRCDAQGRRNAYDADRVTYCHELTHQVNSRIRNTFRGTGKDNAFYVGAGRCVVLPEPRIKLQHVARYIQPQHRTAAFPTAMQFQYWNNEPLYVVDELSAYVNGYQASRELKADPHGEDKFMLAFCHYADCLVRAVKEHDPNYAKLSELTAFVDWQKARAQKLAGSK